jgi:LacI family transcriptional regulator
MPTLHVDDHSSRAAGFHHVFSESYPDYPIVECCVSEASSPNVVARVIGEAFAGAASVAGIFSTGGTTRAVAAALDVAQFVPRPVFVGYDLTTFSRRYLAEGDMDAVIAQSPADQIAKTLAMLMRASDGETLETGAGDVQIEIFMRYNLPPLRRETTTVQAANRLKAVG